MKPMVRRPPGPAGARSVAGYGCTSPPSQDEGGWRGQADGRLDLPRHAHERAQAEELHQDKVVDQDGAGQGSGRRFSHTRSIRCRAGPSGEILLSGRIAHSLIGANTYERPRRRTAVASPGRAHCNLAPTQRRQGEGRFAILARTRWR